MNRIALLAHGFRPFFLLAGLEALAAMAVWLTVYFHPRLWPATPLPAWLWHAHEMVFGFIAAAIAGFLLTAVPNWTGAPGTSGARLMMLVAVWLAGRIAMIPALLPPAAAAAIDLLFFPALGAVLAAPLIRARKPRNLALLGLLALLTLSDLAFHLGRLEVLPGGEFIGLGLGADLIAIIVAVIGGRIIPAFTQSGLTQRGTVIAIDPLPALDAAAILSLVAVLLSDGLPIGNVATGALALVAAGCNGFRLARWQGWRTWRVPLLWVMHVGYAFLVLALLLKGIGLLTGAAAGAKWLHALTIGCFATLIVGVTTRASLGHTGRALVPPRAAVIAYALLPLAALVRVFAPAVAPDHYPQSIALAGTLWLTAFALYLFAYAPILVGPRVDGKPG